MEILLERIGRKTKPISQQKLAFMDRDLVANGADLSIVAPNFERALAIRIAEQRRLVTSFQPMFPVCQ